MKIQPTSQSFGILVKPPVKKVYYPNCWNLISDGKCGDCTFRIYQNYIDGIKCSTLIMYEKLGVWVKSKLKYIENGKRKTLWSYAKDEKDRQHKMV